MQKIQEWPIENVRPYENNPRKIPQKAVDAVAASIKEFGFKQPIVVDKAGVIIVGHTRLKAAEKLGLAKVPVIVASDLTDEQARAYRLADNRTGEIAMWDRPILDDELRRILDIDMMDFGFLEPEPEPEGTDDDFDPDEAMDKARSGSDGDGAIRRGNIFRLGDHILMCGDSTAAEDVTRLMGGGTADMVLTDPPYNVDYGAKNEFLNTFCKGNRNEKDISNDRMGDEAFHSFLVAAFRQIFNVLKDGGAFYIWHADSEGLNFRIAVKESGLTLKQTLIWNKNNFVLGRQDYQWRHEPCLYGWKEGASHYFIEDRSQETVFQKKPEDVDDMTEEEVKDTLKKILSLPATVIDCPKPQRSDEHPTMKPVTLMARLIRNSTRREDIVLDLFGGSGSTLIACEQLGRKCRMMELDPLYCRVIIDRWEKLTGKKAEKVSA